MTISIIGKGKMGESVANYLASRGVDTIIYDSHNTVSLENIIKTDSEIIIDCSIGGAFLSNIDVFLEANQQIIVVSTGWYDQMDIIKTKVTRAGGTLLWADNFSIGIWIYKKLLTQACKLTSQYSNYDVFGLEHHHRIKKDSPAGTTKQIANLILENTPSKTSVSFENQHDQIDPKTLHVVCLRGGENNIIHKFYFDNKDDVIEISHSAKTREGFTEGIIKGIDFVQKTGPGFYNFDDLMNHQKMQ